VVKFWLSKEREGKCVRS